MVSRFSLMVTSTFLAASVGVSPAKAFILLPPPLEIYDFGGHSVNGPGTFTSATTYTSGTTTFAQTPSPSVTSHAQGAGPNGLLYTGGADADTTYYYQITGPTTQSGFVPSFITMSMGASGMSGSYSYYAFAYLTGANIPEIDVCTTYGPSGGTCTNPAQFSGTVSELLPFQGTIVLRAGVTASNGAADSFVDPVISVPSGYTIAFSPGVGNTLGGPATSVPEPAAAVLLLGGLFGLGATRIGRRNSVA